MNLGTNFLKAKDVGVLSYQGLFQASLQSLPPTIKIKPNVPSQDLEGIAISAFLVVVLVIQESLSQMRVQPVTVQWIFFHLEGSVVRLFAHCVSDLFRLQVCFAPDLRTCVGRAV